MINILLAIGTLITAIGGTGYFTLLFAKSKYTQEVEKLKTEIVQAKESTATIAIENDIKLSGHYKEILDDLKNRYETRYKEFEASMMRKVDLLEEEIKLMARKVKLQQQEIIELKKENRILKSNAKNNIS